VCHKLEAKPRWDERVPVCKGPADKTEALYDRAARYRPLLQCVASRILGDSEKAEVAVENCLHSASESAFDCEGAFRGWLVRLAMDEAFAILHRTSVLERRRTGK
jgi:DNA-directed RNA polymerase specialized sigma24 family protein